MEKSCTNCIFGNKIFGNLRVNYDFVIRLCSCQKENKVQASTDYISNLRVKAVDTMGGWSKANESMAKICKYYTPNFQEKCIICEENIVRPNIEFEKTKVDDFCCNNEECKNKLEQRKAEKKILIDGYKFKTFDNFEEFQKYLEEESPFVF